jgi:hypothetical protein
MAIHITKMITIKQQYIACWHDYGTSPFLFHRTFTLRSTAVSRLYNNIYSKPEHYTHIMYFKVFVRLSQ